MCFTTVIPSWHLWSIWSVLHPRTWGRQQAYTAASHQGLHFRGGAVMVTLYSSSSNQNYFKRLSTSPTLRSELSSWVIDITLSRTANVIITITLHKSFQGLALRCRNIFAADPWISIHCRPGCCCTHTHTHTHNHTHTHTQPHTHTHNHTHTIETKCPLISILIKTELSRFPAAIWLNSTFHFDCCVVFE